MTNSILLVFEGEVSERVVWESLNRFFLSGEGSPVVYGVYGGEIYSLYHRMDADPFLDLFSLLKQDKRNEGLLDGLSKDDVSEIYLFFDYDGHTPAASDIKLREMLSFFKEETENGKLYLSYPMVEALRHLHPEVRFEDVVAKCKENIRYKGLVHNESSDAYKDVAQYTHAQWEHVISEHCKKLNKLMQNQYEFPASYFDQSSVFEKQIEKHINPDAMVAVLSAFPIFLLDYYGCANLYKRLNNQPQT